MAIRDFVKHWPVLGTVEADADVGAASCGTTRNVVPGPQSGRFYLSQGPPPPVGDATFSPCVAHRADTQGGLAGRRRTLVDLDGGVPGQGAHRDLQAAWNRS